MLDNIILTYNCIHFAFYFMSKRSSYTAFYKPLPPPASSPQRNVEPSPPVTPDKTLGRPWKSVCKARNVFASLESPWALFLHSSFKICSLSLGPLWAGLENLVLASSGKPWICLSASWFYSRCEGRPRSCPPRSASLCREKRPSRPSASRSR